MAQVRQGFAGPFAALILLVAMVLATASLGSAANKLIISPSNPKQLKNSSLQFTASVNGELVDGPVNWSSSNPAVATISGSSGAALATLVSVGTTTITAIHGGQKSQTSLTVTTATNPTFPAQPTDTNVSAVIDAGTGVKVQLLDNLGGALPGQRITVAIGTNPPGTGTLSGTLMQTTDAIGTATFANLKIDWLGTGYTLVATANPSSGPVSGASAAFNELRVGDPCLGPDTPACQGTCSDADDDGLNDAWEKAGGVDLNGDGLITDNKHDLLLPGADPNKPDVYVRYDWMDYGPMETACNVDADCTDNAGLSGFTCTGPALTEGFRGSCVHSCSQDSDCTALGPSHANDRCGDAGGILQCLHSHDPALLVPNGSGGSAALDAVVQKFAEHGINLHIQRGKAQPHSHVLSYRLLRDPLSPISNSCEGGSVASGTAGPGLYAESFYDLKANSVDPHQILAYHYAIFGHYSSCDAGINHCSTCPGVLNPDGTLKSTSLPHLGQSGVAEVFGNDLIVSLANFTNEAGNPADVLSWGGTFMHELGHNFGLHHGGGFDADGTAEDFPNYKPNYLSVMNYNYQFVGIPAADQVGSNVPDPALSRLDYSTQVLPTDTATPGLLDENGKLDETAGLGSGNSDMFFFTDGACNFQIAPTQGPVDWDGDGVAGDNSAATADLNPSGHPSSPCGSVTTDQFRGHVDWPPNAPPTQFTYGFQCTASGSEDGAIGSGYARPSRSLAEGELTPKMAREEHVLYPTAAVKITIRPGCKSAAEPIAPGRSGTLTLALMGADHLDVNKVDVSSLRFQGATPLATSVTDVDGDGKSDLLVTFDMTDVQLGPQATVARLNGRLNNGQNFVGEDRIRVVPGLTAENTGSGENRAAPPAPPERVQMNVENDWQAIGRADAPVTLVEFADYQCPFCKRFHTGAYAELKKNYIDTGKVRFVSRDLPLEFHPLALKAAEAVRCAGEQGKYWELRDTLYADAGPPNEEVIQKAAASVSLETQAFQACLASGRYTAEVQKDASDAVTLGISGTPTFVLAKTAQDKLEGVRIVGAQPFAAFQSAIDGLLRSSPHGAPNGKGN